MVVPLISSQSKSSNIIKSIFEVANLIFNYELGTATGCNVYILYSIPISSKILLTSGYDNKFFIHSGTKISAITISDSSSTLPNISILNFDSFSGASSKVFFYSV